MIMISLVSPQEALFSNSKRPITTYNENGSVRPHLAGASITQNDTAPRLGPRRGLDRASTCPYSPLPLPLPLPAIAGMPPSLATATIHIPFPMHMALPALRLPMHAHIPLDPRHAHFVHTPHFRLPRPRPHPDPALARTPSHSQQ
jgi:hypothetical protein